jgi:hypothetical protein
MQCSYVTETLKEKKRMSSQLRTILTKTAILSFALMVAIGTTWAGISHSDTDDGIILTNSPIAPQIPSDTPNHDLFVKKPPKDDDGGSEGPKTYSKNMTVYKGGGNWIQLVKGQNKIWVEAYMGDLDAYMEKQGIDEVTITVDLVEQWVETGGQNGYYKLDFTFGPSGAYFTPRDLVLELTGKYVSSDAEVTLLDEYGEEVPSTVKGGGGHFSYYIPHFSNYYYDDYDY